MADNLPLRDPTSLFHSEIYKRHGIAVWPDLWKTHPHNPTWRFLGRPCTRDEWTFESGQFIIDKAGNEGLNLAILWMAVHFMDDYEFWGKYIHGDKDAFRLALWILDLEWGRAPRYPGIVGGMREDGRFCG